MKPLRVEIEVVGGVAHVLEKSKGVIVVIHDYDCEGGHGSDADPCGEGKHRHQQVFRSEERLGI